MYWAGDFETMMFGQHLSSQGRTKIRVLLLDDAQCIIAFGRVEPIVRRTSARLVPDRRSTVLAITLQQPEDLPPCQAQHVRRIVDAK